jgi:hypothetical protein
MRIVEDFGLKIDGLRREFGRRQNRFGGDTQPIRGGLIADLEEAFDFAQKRMKAMRKEKHKQFWARLVAYIAQTIAYVAREYDLSKINKKLEELEEKS